MIKRLVVPLLLVAFFAQGCSSLAVAAATVNGDKITESQVESELDTLRDDPVFGEALSRDPDTRGQRRREILNELIYQQIAIQQSRRFNVKVTRAQIDRLIQQAADSRAQTREDFLESQNLTMDQARKLGERGVRRFALIEKVVTGVDVDDKTVRAAYEGQQDRFVEVHLEKITTKTEMDARSVVEDIGGGDSFSDVAMDRSIDGFAKDGGDMGYVPLTALDVEVQGAVGRAVEGGLTDPVRLPTGFEVYRLVDRRTKSFKDVEGEIRQALTQEERDQRYQAWLASKVKAAKIAVNPKYGRFDRTQPEPAVVPSRGELRP